MRTYATLRRVLEHPKHTNLVVPRTYSARTGPVSHATSQQLLQFKKNYFFSFLFVLFW